MLNFDLYGKKKKMPNDNRGASGSPTTPVAVAARYGSCSAWGNGSTLEEYIFQMDTFFLLNGVEDGKKVRLVLLGIDARALKVAKFCAPKNIDDVSYTEAKNASQ